MELWYYAAIDFSVWTEDSIIELPMNWKGWVYLFSFGTLKFILRNIFFCIKVFKVHLLIENVWALVKKKDNTVHEN